MFRHVYALGEESLEVCPVIWLSCTRVNGQESKSILKGRLLVCRLDLNECSRQRWVVVIGASDALVMRTSVIKVHNKLTRVCAAVAAYPLSVHKR
jgi:hypothetical protein